MSHRSQGPQPEITIKINCGKREIQYVIITGFGALDYCTLNNSDAKSRTWSAPSKFLLVCSLTHDRNRKSLVHLPDPRPSLYFSQYFWFLEHFQNWRIAVMAQGSRNDNLANWKGEHWLGHAGPDSTKYDILSYCTEYLYIYLTHDYWLSFSLYCCLMWFIR
jgi:hypothetical protein